MYSTNNAIKIAGKITKVVATGALIVALGVGMTAKGIISADQQKVKELRNTPGVECLIGDDTECFTRDGIITGDEYLITSGGIHSFENNYRPSGPFSD